MWTRETMAEVMGGKQHDDTEHFARMRAEEMRRRQNERAMQRYKAKRYNAQIYNPIANRFILGEMQRIRLDLDNLINKDVIYQQHLENCTDDVQSAPEGGTGPMAYKREWVNLGLDENGKPIRKQISGKTQDERNAEIVKAYIQSGKIRDFLTLDVIKELGLCFNNEVQSPKEPEKPKHDLEVFVREWYEQKKKCGIAKTYEEQLKHRLKMMLKCSPVKYVEDFSTDAVISMLDKRIALSRKGRIGKDLMKSFIQTVKEVLNQAEYMGFIQSRAIDWKKIKNIGTKGKVRKVITNKQFDSVLSQIPDLEDQTEQISVALLSYAALRLEELLGLRCEDIVEYEDLSEEEGRRRLYINRALVHVSGGYEIKEPKTESSQTWIPVSDELWTYLKKYKGGTGWIVHDENGEPFKKRCRWMKFWNQIGEHIELYGLRACEFRKQVPTYLLTKNKSDIKSVQRLLRHKKADMTVNTYAESDMEAVIAAVNSIGK